MTTISEIEKTTGTASGQASAELKGITGAEALRRGMASSSGAGGTVNLVDAHRWFNIAAVLGEEEAALLRSETALDMTKQELAAALRAAREFMTLH